ncbi:MAG: alanine--tRNA ligase [Gammaproteobacteria bacterium]|nr:MAG: alanine--tRNA ligase [Gammaproteobacteria bacterium]
MRSTSELRSGFLDYFNRHGHEVVPSSSLVPGNDPTLLFTNAGMVPFKEVFLGNEQRANPRAASSQRCVRAGGKHNDLENVGFTARHHTFFEMLGNFSFGDYFKEEAIDYAWGFLTKELTIDPNRLWVTVFEEDNEAAELWLKKIGVPESRFRRIGAKDNFWSMGTTGPCGPCTEIFYDHGDHIAGGPPGSPDEDGDRFVEIWNLVFMQYERSADGTLTNLPKPSVDTGMGLERIAAVMQGTHDNYEIDLFKTLLSAAAEVTATATANTPSHRVIADHIRSCAFLVADGVLPSNEGRGYVLRRIIRRAIRHGYELGQKQSFFSKLVAPLSEVMGKAYPELVSKQEIIRSALAAEEERFAETLEHGMKILGDEAERARAQGGVIPGDVVFKLYDTYGFPVDLTADYAQSYQLSLDMQGFDKNMDAQRERARAASRFGADNTVNVGNNVASTFTGYDNLSGNAEVIALFKDGESATELSAGDSGIVVLDQTPFYAEAGGQIGDRGQIAIGQSHFVVKDTQKLAGGKAHGHVGMVVDGAVRIGDKVNSQVDSKHRISTVRHHSATHLLHAALREVLGGHVEQKGSLVEAERLRFDFSHPQPVSKQELEAIEKMVNEQVLENVETDVALMPIKEAMAKGAMALFGEKYGDIVRVLRFGDFSVELCGGTHVARTGDIGLFKITSESGVASGVRRIEAVCGRHALAWLDKLESTVDEVASLMRADRATLAGKVKQFVDKQRELEKTLGQLRQKMSAQASDNLADQAQEINGVNLLVARVDGVDVKSLRETVDRLKDQLAPAAVLLATVDSDKVMLVAGVTKDLVDRIPANQLINVVAEKVGGKGGGRPDMAQAGGSRPAELDSSLALVPAWVAAKLNG